MIFTISKDDILAQLIRQLESFFMLHRDEKELLGRLMDDVMGRCAYCFGKNENKYFKHEGETCFNPYISAQYVIFLYYFSNSVYRTLSSTEKKQNTGNLSEQSHEWLRLVLCHRTAFLFPGGTSCRKRHGAGTIRRRLFISPRLYSGRIYAHFKNPGLSHNRRKCRNVCQFYHHRELHHRQ